MTVHSEEELDAELDSVVKLGDPIVAIAESVSSDGYLAMHSESFIEIKLPVKNASSDLKELIGKWITVKPISHSDGVLICEKL